MALLSDIDMTLRCAVCDSEEADIVLFDSAPGKSRHARFCRACADSRGFEALEKDGVERIASLDVEVTPEHLSIARMQDYKGQMARAIREERYEDAARLRDLISMESILASLR